MLLYNNQLKAPPPSQLQKTLQKQSSKPSDRSRQNHSPTLLHLKSGKSLPSNSRLSRLALELDNSTNLIWVGGRLRQISQLEEDNIHPIVLDPHHPLTKLIIRDYDDSLHHPGSERLFTELQRKFWVLRGRAAVRHHQWQCTECQ